MSGRPARVRSETGPSAGLLIDRQTTSHVPASDPEGLELFSSSSSSPPPPRGSLTRRSDPVSLGRTASIEPVPGARTCVFGPHPRERAEEVETATEGGGENSPTRSMSSSPATPQEGPGADRFHCLLGCLLDERYPTERSRSPGGLSTADLFAPDRPVRPGSRIWRCSKPLRDLRVRIFMSSRAKAHEARRRRGRPGVDWQPCTGDSP